MAVIAVVAIIVMGLRGDLSAVIGIPAVIAVVTAAWYLGRRALGQETVQAISQPVPDGDALTTDVIAAIPDPTVLLDADGRVVALNASVSAVAPALRRGEPASLGLRIPEVVDAIRRAALGRKPERVEFSERVPAERWFEVFVTPLRTDGGADNRTRLLLTFR
ncbi:MAG: PAS domain-containing protein, partial [Sphingomonas sp.]